MILMIFLSLQFIVIPCRKPSSGPSLIYEKENQETFSSPMSYHHSLRILPVNLGQDQFQSCYFVQMWSDVIQANKVLKSLLNILGKLETILFTNGQKLLLLNNICLLVLLSLLVFLLDLNFSQFIKELVLTSNIFQGRSQFFCNVWVCLNQISGTLEVCCTTLSTW